MSDLYTTVHYKLLHSTACSENQTKAFRICLLITYGSVVLVCFLTAITGQSHVNIYLSVF